MRRWLGWTIVLGLGGALATGCGSRQEDTSGGTGGSGDQGVAVHERDQGPPYQLPAPQPVPRERRSAPLGVGGGPDNARRMALEQLKPQ